MHSLIRSLVCALSHACLLLGLFGSESAGETPRPNFLVIVVDDLGYGETGMMGNGEIATPAIDALAASGVRCTSGYVTSSYCSPSRAAMLTGRYQSRFGYDINPTGPLNLHPMAGLPVAETTVATRLKQGGYRTGLFGKWHLGTSPQMRPAARGFEEFWGFLHEGHYYVSGPPYTGVWTMVRDKTVPRGEVVRDGFLYRGHYAPIDEPLYDADNPVQFSRGQFTELADHAGYLTDQITEEAIAFMKAHNDEPFVAWVAYNAVHSPMQSLLADAEQYSHLQDPQRRIFAGMLTALDRGVAGLIRHLETAGLREKTLVVFISDNGGPTAELTSSNGPLRGGKGDLYEGGVRVPMLWSFPGVLPAGVADDRIVLSTDIAASMLAAAGLPAEPQADGFDVLDKLGSETTDPIHREVFWRMPRGRRAFRQGRWKMVQPSSDRPPELYDLQADISESHNLARSQPEQLAELLARWESYDAQMQPTIELSVRN